MVNPLSTVLSFALPATLGSGISVAFHASAVWCFGEVVLRAGFSRDRLMWAAAACLTLYAATSFTAFWVNGVSDDYGALLPLLTLVVLPFTYSVLACARKDDLALGAVAGSVIGAYGAGAEALVGTLLAGGRAEGLSGNPLVFAQVVGLAGSVCLIALVLGVTGFRGRSYRGVIAGAYAAATLALLLSGSRTAWVVFVLQTALVMGVGWARARPRVSLRGALAGAAVALVVGLVAYGPVVRRAGALARDWSKLDQSNYNTSLGLRLRLFEVGMGYAREHPFIGWGVASNRTLVTRGLANEFDLHRTFSHFHNGFVTALVETGLIGLGALLALLVVVAVAAARGVRRDNPNADRFGGLTLAVLWLATVIGGLTNIVIGHDILDATLMVGLGFGLFLAIGTPRPEPGAATTEGTIHG